ncbi:hypothetical protein Kpol_1066p4 [Vanderwaltozyma polyspora DSM 70294]|uniref:Uncharacterized protein n=1 Tax=Vanderwaltozyma polyspora (strain ATCC 22028 / DSM 70294 / BCRC 21397 / CBS 2163 / NBRC 10782 / NRRL Y-8283 / UCD 57-17) TaxID=436907 RepID=A7TMM6_VANPO|nr:uncharacterized protein Kpol_1066p4 [Vanderwaltozyma polyspora DSM 70294]EDO16440.1 hypothetical protein Kpol_1066p4 [Vanderwaltozyma polyspora DSM 70294]
MFGGGGGSSNKPKRRSFFFLGGSNESTPASSRTVSKNDGKKVKETKTTRSVSAPKEKLPLNRSGFMINDIKADKNMMQKRIPTPVIQTQNNNTANNNDKININNNNANNNNNSNNPFRQPSLVAEEPVRRETRSRRPPPPTVDLSLIQPVISNGPLRNELQLNNHNASESTMDMSNFIKGPEEIGLDSSRADVPSSQQHRRQRSEAEKLVDDIAEYIEEQQIQNKNSNRSLTASIDELPPVSPVDELHLNTDNLSIMDGNGDSRTENLNDFDNSLSNDEYSDRLNLGVEKVPSSSIGDTSSLNISTGLESERFSFTGTVDAKSIQSYQNARSSTVDNSTSVLKISNINTNEFSDQSSSSNSSENNQGYINTNSRIEKNSNHSNLENLSTETSDNEDYVIYNSYTNTDGDSCVSGPKTFRVVNQDSTKFTLGTDDDLATSTEDDVKTNDLANSFNDLANSFNDLDFKSGSLDSHNRDVVTPTVETHDSISKNGSFNIASRPEIPSIPTSPETADLSIYHQSSKQIRAAINSNSINNSSSTVSSTPISNKRDTNVRLVSSYVEELRLKYFTTSNFLQAPPNLPITLKQKNNLIQPKNIKVTIRTSSKQIGIKHGKVKTKLLALETTNEDSNENTVGSSQNPNKIVDHTKEFHNLIKKKDDTGSNDENDHYSNSYMKDIPGDDAYDSDDILAPLRKKNSLEETPTRHNTVVSYYTKTKTRLRSGTLDNSYSQLQELPSNILISDYEDKENIKDANYDDVSNSEGDSEQEYITRGNLHIANPDGESD